MHCDRQTTEIRNMKPTVDLPIRALYGRLVMDLRFALYVCLLIPHIRNKAHRGVSREMR